ncbi:MAG TPA: TlpA disulfide reductase family protein [Acidimicrobiales bacterium]|nr:TlpA disulfide reductase family protein [Acidimicrobiales bacterium]
MSTSPTVPLPVRRHRPVLWAAIGMGVAVAVLIAVIASAQPSSEVEGKSPLLGGLAPAISGPGLDGGHLSLGEFRGKWVLVNFMATWCEPCQKEMPQLQKFWQQHSKRGDAVVLTVADDPGNVGQLRAFLRAKRAGWPAVNDPSATVSYGLQGLPSSFLVAPDGTVYWYLLGEVRASQLDSLLQQGAASGLGAA